MTFRSMQGVQPNMDVFTADAAHVGRVKTVRENDFLVDREHARDIYVPITMVNQVLDGEQRVELNLTEADVSRHDWENPPLLSS